jgi:hypothetical protein
MAPMGTRDIKIGTILDGMRWMRSCAFSLLSTPSGSTERRARLAELTMATAKARAMAQTYRGKMAPELRLAIGVAEAALRHFGERSGGSGSAGSGDANPKGGKVHPRHATAMIRR